MPSLSESNYGQTVDVRQGETVRIPLPKNATTGYRWAIDRHDEDCIEAIATEPRYAKDAVGSGGEVEFVFEAKKVGIGEIVLKNWRHWEGDSSVAARFRVTLRVQA